MDTISKDELLNKLKTTKCLCKFRNDSNYSCYTENIIYCSSLNKLRNDDWEYSDRKDGLVIGAIRFYGHLLDSIHLPSPYKYVDVTKETIFINPEIFEKDDTGYTYDIIELNNFVFCISKYDESWTMDDIEHLIRNYGEYVFVIDYYMELVKIHFL